MKRSWARCCTSDANSAMWAKARSLASRRLKPAFANLKFVSADNQEINAPDVSDAPADDPPRTDTADGTAAAPSEREQVQAEIAELQDRLLRQRAEFENFRRRADRDRSDFLQFAGMEVVRELLPILDDFG